MKSTVILTWALIMTAVVSSLRCTHDSCHKVVCPEVTKKNCHGRIDEKGSVCLGCCDVCYRILEPGAVCADVAWLTDNKEDYVYVECPEGFYCDYLDSLHCLKSK